MKWYKKVKVRILTFSIAMCVICSCIKIVNAKEEKVDELTGLYALSAVLMDADSGRVLYEKDGYTKRAMASTTKIMTCILALEYGKLDELVSVSKYAASMPDVQLNIKQGEMYILNDLLYSLMLESHNDVAVAIAEHIGGSVEGFALLMNEKAKELGCFDTYFITPNGLDATTENNGETQVHSTTARDLAKIMSYCINNEDFLSITRKDTYTFTNKIKLETGEIVNGERSHSVTNRNTLLKNMDGLISGKTGYTNDAGYCYVCAFEKDGKKYTVALLGCGWPNNKNYKWSDTRKLLDYGVKNYVKKDMFIYNMEFDEIPVNNGVMGLYYDFGTRGINADKITHIKPYVNEEAFVLLSKEDETITPTVTLAHELEAPVYKDQIIGTIQYKTSDGITKDYNIYANETIKKKDYIWSFGCVFIKFILH